MVIRPWKLPPSKGPPEAEVVCQESVESQPEL